MSTQHPTKPTHIPTTRRIAYYALTTEGSHIIELLQVRHQGFPSTEQRTGRRWPATETGERAARAAMREANRRLWAELREEG